MKMTKRMVRVFLLTVAALTLGLVLPGAATAAEKVKITTDTAWIGYPDALCFDDAGYFDEEGYEFEGMVGGTSIPANITIISAKSSKPGVLQVKKVANTVELRAKKTGKAKVTVKYTDKAGATGTISKTIRTKKFQDPIKTLKINGKKIKLDKGDPYCFPRGFDEKKGDMTIKVTLNSGWKLVKGKKNSYVLTEHDDIETDETTVEYLKFTNGMTFTKEETYDSVYVRLTLKHKKKGTMTFTISM